MQQARTAVALCVCTFYVVLLCVCFFLKVELNVNWNLLLEFFLFRLSFILLLLMSFKVMFFILQLVFGGVVVRVLLFGLMDFNRISMCVSWFLWICFFLNLGSFARFQWTASDSTVLIAKCSFSPLIMASLSWMKIEVVTVCCCYCCYFCLWWGRGRTNVFHFFFPFCTFISVLFFLFTRSLCTFILYRNGEVCWRANRSRTGIVRGFIASYAYTHHSRFAFFFSFFFKTSKWFFEMCCAMT